VGSRTPHDGPLH